MRKRVFVSGPLSKGDRQENVRRAMQTMRELVVAGYAVHLPHLAHFVDPTDALGYENWLEVCLSWVVRSDAVLRLSGESPGADMEVSCAKDHRVPVFYSITELLSGLPAR